jgi:hypothetical protein
MERAAQAPVTRIAAVATGATHGSARRLAILVRQAGSRSLAEDESAVQSGARVHRRIGRSRAGARRRLLRACARGCHSIAHAEVHQDGTATKSGAVPPARTIGDRSRVGGSRRWHRSPSRRTNARRCGRPPHRRSRLGCPCSRRGRRRLLAPPRLSTRQRRSLHVLSFDSRYRGIA